jgi:undecaprenyl pyrophosphate phosphatase UppP
MFLALLKHTWSKNAHLNANKYYLTANAVAGLVVTGIGIVVAFVPSRQVSSVWIFEAKLIAACLIVFGAALFFYQRALRKARTSPAEDLVPGVEYGS